MPITKFRPPLPFHLFQIPNDFLQLRPPLGQPFYPALFPRIPRDLSPQRTGASCVRCPFWYALVFEKLGLRLPSDLCAITIEQAQVWCYFSRSLVMVI